VFSPAWQESYQSTVGHVIVNDAKVRRKDKSMSARAMIARQDFVMASALPELLVAIQPRVSLAARPEKREYSR
jgi:hypothetical protein